MRHMKVNGKRCKDVLSVTVSERGRGLMFLTSPASLVCCSLRKGFVGAAGLRKCCRSVTVSGKIACLRGTACVGGRLSASSVAMVTPSGRGARLLGPLQRVTPCYFVKKDQLGKAAPVMFAEGFSGAVCRLRSKGVAPCCSFSFVGRGFPRTTGSGRCAYHRLGGFA